MSVKSQIKTDCQISNLQIIEGTMKDWEKMVREDGASKSKALQ
jgi:hypothetical protein